MQWGTGERISLYDDYRYVSANTLAVKIPSLYNHVSRDRFYRETCDTTEKAVQGKKGNDARMAERGAVFMVLEKHDVITLMRGGCPQNARQGGNNFLTAAIEASNRFIKKTTFFMGSLTAHLEVKNMSRLIVALGIISTLFALLTANATADELANTQWPSFRHDIKNTGRSQYAGPKWKPGHQWKVPAHSLIEASPIVGPDGTIYIGSGDNVFYAITSTGKIKWTFRTQSLIRSTAAIGMDGTIYFGSNDCCLYALTERGKLQWSYTTNGPIGSSPTVGPDGTIYFGCNDTYLYAIRSNGNPKWRYKTGHKITFSTPAIADDGTIYVGSYDHKLHAVNPDGSQKWTFPTSGPVRTSPSIADDGTVYVGSRDGSVYAVNPDGTLKWSFSTGDDVRSSTAIGADGTIYFGSWDQNLYAVKPDGTLKWYFPTPGRIATAPAIDADGTIFISCGGGPYYAINPNGSLLWQTASCIVHTSPTIGGHGTIYGTFDYTIHALGPPLPQVSFGLNGHTFYPGDTVKVDARLKNDAGVPFEVEIKVWLIDPNGWRSTLFKSPRMTLARKSNHTKLVLDHTLTKPAKWAAGRYTLGASVLHPKTGEFYNRADEHFVFYLQ
jgi:outer membrane protein assembly factor BamB